jgi:hypothetical protein
MTTGRDIAISFAVTALVIFFILGWLWWMTA